MTEKEKTSPGGAGEERKCPRCSGPTDQADKYCQYCGSNLETGEPNPSIEEDLQNRFGDDPVKDFVRSILYEATRFR